MNACVQGKEHDFSVGAAVVQGECHEGGDIMVFGGRKTSGEEGAICENCGLIWNTDTYDKSMVYAISFLSQANFPMNNPSVVK